jgi:succinyl-CoA synthetase beta subunit
MGLTTKLVIVTSKEGGMTIDKVVDWDPAKALVNSEPRKNHSLLSKYHHRAEKPSAIKHVFQRP